MFQEKLISKVALTISCRNLKDLDLLSKSDPMAVVFHKVNNCYIEYGRTEVIINNLNPVFAKVFEIDYYFEERQLFKVEIYDNDSKSTRLSDHDFLGRYEFSLGELVSRQKMEAMLSDCKLGVGKKQTIILCCQEVSNCKESIKLQINCSKLDKKDLFGKSDPLIEIYRCNDSVEYIKEETNFKNYNYSLAYRSKPIMNTLNPSWPEFSLHLSHLCCGDKNRLIKFVIFDWNSDGSQDLIGHCFTSVNHLLSIHGKSTSLELINEKKNLKKKNYKNSGTLTINKVIIEPEYSFIDYISGGTELHFTVAIDFTASNGKRSDPNSLHYIPHNAYIGMANQYESAINAVGSIIQDYDSDKLFPALGFGARIPPQNQVSHCFPINFRPENPYCSGVNGLLSAYRSVIQAISLSGPTNFSPIIRHVQQFAQSHRNGSKYFVLLIITDGIITDFDKTIDAIIDCSYLPMSIIIIGVGNEDFSAMDMLDCDNGRLSNGLKVSQRDIVQFVPIVKYFSKSTKMINQEALSKDVLFELPGQLTCWMKANQIKPLPPNNSSTFVSASVVEPNNMCLNFQTPPGVHMLPNPSQIEPTCPMPDEYAIHTQPQYPMTNSVQGPPPYPMAASSSGPPLYTPARNPLQASPGYPITHSFGHGKT